MYRRSRLLFIAIASMLSSGILVFNTTACINIRIPGSGNKDFSGTTQSAIGKTRPHPPARTGDITLGQKVDLSSQSIGKDGGGIVISRPGDPLDGFSLGVPAGAYPDNRAFKVSYAPILKQTFGDDITPISPMIMVDNGGGYADDIIYMKVPVKVPDGYFAMGFLYDEKRRQLEGMPLITYDANSVTIATMHFTNVFIGAAAKSLLKGDIDTGFRPGIDDFQFVNRGSYIAANGHCSGQSLASMWYYCTGPDGKDACLYGRYDNNGKKPATPDLWQDDSLAYRLCSIVQTDNERTFSEVFWRNLGGRFWVFNNGKWRWEDIPGLGIDDEMQYYMVAFSMTATREPQYIGVSTGPSGHALIAYKIVGNAIYVADPNYPGITDRKIIYYSGEKKFKPYQSGANRDEIEKGLSIAFTNITYLAKSTLANWNTIAGRWAEFKQGTIGNDKFPQYELVVVNDSGTKTPLRDGFITTHKMCDIGVIRKTGDHPLTIIIYRDGIALPLDNSGKVELKPGNNLLGIHIEGTINNRSKYVDFKYVNVVCKLDETPAPAATGPLPYIAANSKLDLGPVYESWLKSNNRNFYDWSGFEVPITWNGLTFTGKLEKTPMAGMGTGKISVEISGTLSKVPKPKDPFTLTLNYAAKWDVTNSIWHDTGSVVYKITSVPMYVWAMTNQEGHWMLRVTPPEDKGAAVQKYLSSIVIRTDKRYVGDPRRRADYPPDQVWIYTDNTCANAAGTNDRPTELNISIRCPFNWQTKTDK